jgi:hypothetical protein
LVDTSGEATMSTMEKRKRRAFTPEFKAEAVKLVREGGKTVTAVARDLGLTVSALRAWVKQAVELTRFRGVRRLPRARFLDHPGPRRGGAADGGVPDAQHAGGGASGQLRPLSALTIIRVAGLRFSV